MKILLFYTPRTGSTSILNYFEKLNPNYECFNEPWFEWMIENLHKNKIEYSELISKKNIFIKSTYKTIPISLDTLVNDFDKIIILLRKNQKEQVESSILAHKEYSFLNSSPRLYSTYNITDEEFKSKNKVYDFLNKTLVEFANLNNLPIFYYEDLYYNDFTPLFNELELQYNQEYYEEYLNISKKYRVGDIELKTTKTLF